ncbi:hypothetical protein KEM56_002296 [Ascosphaera pollenicola]|nr:hypothetical protein KEM56_002296 [Ascosphaera pollenicola]
MTQDRAQDTHDASDSEGEDVFYDAFYPSDEEAELLNKSATEKAAANKLFASARYSEAVSSYDRALSFVPNYLEYDVAVLKSNIAACHLKLEDWKAAVTAATASLKMLDRLDPPPSKPKAEGDDTENDENKRPQAQASQKQPEQANDSGIVELPDDADESTLAKLEAEDKRKEDIRRIRAKSLMRRARAKMELGGWSNLEGATDDYNKLLALGNLPPQDEKIVKRNLREMPAKIAAAKEKEMGEMMSKLKELGNGILNPFGLSTDNFKFIKDEKTGGYNMSFER